MNLRDKAVKGVGWSAVQNFGSQGISLIIFLVLARLLGPEVFGLVAMANIFVMFVQVFLDQGLGQAIIQRTEFDDTHLDSAFWANLAVGALLMVVALLASGQVAALFHEPKLAPVVCGLAPIFLIRALIVVQEAVLTREFKFKSLATRSLVASGAGGAAGITLALLGFGVWSLVGQQLVNRLVEVATLWRVSSWRPGFKVSLKPLKELLGFGVNVTAFNLSNFFNRRSDDFLIGYFLGPVALGHYTVAYRVLTVMTQLLAATTTQVALPTFSKMQEQPERLRSAFYTVTQFTSLISFPAFLGVAVLAPELVVTLFGSQWTESIPVMEVLALVGIQQSVFFFNCTVMMAMGRPDWRLWNNMLNSIIGIVCFAIAVRWGIVAVAIAFVVRVWLLSPVSYWFVHRLITLNLGQYLRRYLPALASSVVMCAALWSVKALLGSTLGPGALLAVCAAVGTVVYALALRLGAPDIFHKLLEFSWALLPKRADARTS